ncbi:MAG: hypothetical protein JST36_07620 [Bacteroidetes bacterium]|nr:hypothetical protein [Bacteroidota bacterium]
MNDIEKLSDFDLFQLFEDEKKECKRWKAIYQVEPCSHSYKHFSQHRDSYEIIKDEMARRDNDPTIVLHILNANAIPCCIVGNSIHITNV